MPLGWFYGTLNSIRNKLYDRGVFESYQSHLKTVVIGNLQVGGSGKTPHTALLYHLLKDRFKIGILSRGYGRKTKGLVIADSQSNALTIGDESFWYYNTLKKASVVVSEKRKVGLLCLEKLNVDLVLLDDAYQHRAVTCTLNILLTDFKLPYYNDHVMPFGRLREWKTGDKRAHIIIVTKCPSKMTIEQKIGMIQSINPYDYQFVFFTTIKSLKPYSLKGTITFESLKPDKIIAMSGIANPDHFAASCAALGYKIEPLSFGDHHVYSAPDILRMLSMLNSESVVMITEKDASKLVQADILALIPSDKVFVLPIEPVFLFNEENKFRETISTFLK